MGPRGRRVPAVQERVLKTGVCQTCNHPLLDPTEPGLPDGPLTFRDQMETIGMIAVLLLGFGGWAYFGGPVVRQEHRVLCARRYAAALTGADTARVDQDKWRDGFWRKSSVTCRDLR